MGFERQVSWAGVTGQEWTQPFLRSLRMSDRTIDRIAKGGLTINSTALSGL